MTRRPAGGPRAEGERREVRVYALTTAAPRLPAVTGIGGERLQLVTVAGIGAIVGPVRRASPAGTRPLLQYAALVERLARERPALLPVRYGTSLPAEELVFILGARRSSLRAALAAVRRRAQMNVHLAEPAVLARGAEAGPRPAPRPPRGATRGTSYLRTRAAAAARDTEVAGFAPLRAAVRRWVRDERVEKDGTAITVCHLVPRGSIEIYRRTLERAASAQGVTVSLTGPWAPYAFADPLGA